MNGVALRTREEDRSDVGFDRFASGYVEDVDRSVSFTGRDSAFYARRKVEVLEEIVLRGSRPLGALSLLDVGCGTGTTDQVLAPRVRSLHGVDVSAEMLVQARQNVPEAEFSWYDGATFPFDDGAFDVVVAICVFHHIPVAQRRQVASEMVRVTRPGGFVAVFEHNPYNPLTRHAVNTCELDRDAVLLPARETIELLQQSAHVDPEYRHYLFSPLGGGTGRSLDRHLRKIPLGGQYVSWVQRSTTRPH